MRIRCSCRVKGFLVEKLFVERLAVDSKIGLLVKELGLAQD
jgi:hypothetical protein